MKPLWAKAATGVLIGAVGLGLALLPSRLVTPEGDARPLALPQSLPLKPVVAVTLSVHHRPVSVHRVVQHAPVAQLASVFVPVHALAPTPRKATPRPKPHPTVARPPVAHRPRVFVEPARPTTPTTTTPTSAPTPAPTPAPAPAAEPAAAPTLTQPAPTPPPSRADQSPPPPTTTTTETTPSPPDEHNHDHGHGGDDHGHGHGHGR
jgi:hypothetical protein